MVSSAISAARTTSHTIITARCGYRSASAARTGPPITQGRKLIAKVAAEAVTGSVTASAATFAISFLPWVIGGPVLAALAERYPHRAVMIVCDVVRAALIALLTIPHLPVPAMLVILFGAALLNPPFDASRSALLPRVLDGDRYVVGIAVQNSTGQAA